MEVREKLGSPCVTRKNMNQLLLQQWKISKYMYAECLRCVFFPIFCLRSLLHHISFHPSSTKVNLRNVGININYWTFLVFCHQYFSRLWFLKNRKQQNILTIFLMEHLALCSMHAKKSKKCWFCQMLKLTSRQEYQIWILYQASSAWGGPITKKTFNSFSCVQFLARWKGKKDSKSFL